MKLWQRLQTVPGIILTLASVGALLVGALAFAIRYYGDQRYVMLVAYEDDDRERESSQDKQEIAELKRLQDLELKLTGEMRRLELSKADFATTDLKLVDMDRRARETETQLREIKQQQAQLIEQNARLQTTAEHTIRQIERLTNLLEKQLLPPSKPSS